MEKIIRKLLSIGWIVNPPADEDLIRVIKSSLYFKIPEDYLDFLRIANGGEGFIGDDFFLMMWKLEDLIKLNEGYKVQKYTPGFFYFGSNGGEEAFAFDLRSIPITVSSIPFINSGVSEAQEVSPNITELLEQQLNLLN